MKRLNKIKNILIISSLSIVLLSMALMQDTFALPFGFNYKLSGEINIKTTTSSSELIKKEEVAVFLEDLSGQDKTEAIKGIEWIEENFLDTNLNIKSGAATSWSKPTTTSIPIYTAQVKDVTWWAPITIRFRVRDLLEPFEIFLLKDLWAQGIEFEILYWQSNAYTKNYGHTSMVLSGVPINTNPDDRYSQAKIAPLINYDGKFPEQIVGGLDAIKLPASSIEREIRFSILVRPNSDALIPIRISHTNVDVSIHLGQVW